MNISSYIGRKKRQLLTSKGDRLPDVIIIGTQKSATTSLYHYLQQHPNVTGSFKKELHFFDADYTYQKGIDYYKRQFPSTQPENKLLEATPNYIYHEKVADRIAQLDHTFKFICVFRHPLKRALSAWNMYRQLASTFWFRKTAKKNSAEDHLIYDLYCKNEFPSFSSAVKAELKWIHEDRDIKEPALLGRGFYKPQVQYWIDRFNDTSFYFMQQEELTSPAATKSKLDELLKFIGITDNSYFLDTLNLDEQNKRSYKQDEMSQLDDELKQELMVLFQNRNNGLDSLTGLSIPWLTE